MDTVCLLRVCSVYGVCHVFTLCVCLQYMDVCLQCMCMKSAVCIFITTPLYHGLEYHVKKIGCYHHCQGHSEGIYL